MSTYRLKTKIIYATIALSNVTRGGLRTMSSTGLKALPLYHVGSDGTVGEDYRMNMTFRVILFLSFSLIVGMIVECLLPKQHQHMH